MTDLQTIGTISGSISDGGWKAQGSIFRDADSVDWYYPIKSWIRLFASGWEASPRQAFTGHIAPKEWTKNFLYSEAPWEAFTAQQFLKNGRVQGIFFKETALPANEHQITNMTYADIVEHIITAHTNLAQGYWPEGFMDLDIDTAHSVLAGEHEVKEGPMWSKILEIANIEKYIVYVDLQNVFHYVPHPMFGASLPDPVFELNDSWLADGLKINPRNPEQAGQVVIQGTTPAGQQISAKYPTSPEAGPIVVLSGYKASSTTGMSTVAERQYKYSNRDVTVKAVMPGAVGLMVDLMDRISITYSSAEDGVSWSQKKFWIDTINVRLMENFTAITELTLEAENA